MSNIFNEARNVQLENALEDRQWTATHASCGGKLILIDGKWSCDMCEVDFHDEHCADVATEERDRRARESASSGFSLGGIHAKKAESELVAERASIRKDILAHREQWSKVRADHIEAVANEALQRIDAATTHTELAHAAVDAIAKLPKHADAEDASRKVNDALQGKTEEVKAYSDAIAILQDAADKLDGDGATEAEAQRMFGGGDNGDGLGDRVAGIMEWPGAVEAFEKTHDARSVAMERKATAIAEGAIARAAERDRVAAEAEAHAKGAQAKLDSVATESAGSGGGHGDSAGDEGDAFASAGVPGTEPGEAHATTEPPPSDTPATPATDGGDDKPPPTE